MGRKKKHAESPNGPEAGTTTDEGAVPDAASAEAEPPNATGGAAEPASPEADQAPEASLEEQLAHLQDRHLRLRAEFDNFRRRSRQDMETARLAAQRALLEAFLPVFRSLEEAAQAAEGEVDVDGFREGVRLVKKGLRDALSQQGVTEIAPRGEPFDGALMEAVGMVPSPDVPEGHVLEVFQNGYRVGEQLLHPARVLVSSGPPSGETETSSE